MSALAAPLLHGLAAPRSIEASPQRLVAVGASRFELFTTGEIGVLGRLTPLGGRALGQNGDVAFQSELRESPPLLVTDGKHAPNEKP